MWVPAQVLSGVRVTVPSGIIGDAESSLDPSVQIIFQRWGVYGSIGNGGSLNGDWITPKYATVGDFYQIFATEDILSTSSPTGGSALDTWHILDQTRLWSLQRSIIGTSTCILNISIRRFNSLTVLSTGQVTMEATKEL